MSNMLVTGGNIGYCVAERLAEKGVSVRVPFCTRLFSAPRVAGLPFDRQSIPAHSRISGVHCGTGFRD
jgi:ribosomal protein L18